jgi:hypothetical protein
MKVTRVPAGDVVCPWCHQPARQLDAGAVVRDPLLLLRARDSDSFVPRGPPDGTLQPSGGRTDHGRPDRAMRRHDIGKVDLKACVRTPGGRGRRTQRSAHLRDHDRRSAGAAGLADGRGGKRGRDGVHRRIGVPLRSVSPGAKYPQAPAVPADVAPRPETIVRRDTLPG